MTRPLTPAKAAELLARARAHDVEIRPNRFHPTTEFEARSMRDPHVWYRMPAKTDTSGRLHAKCSCQGFQRVGYCSHYVLLAWECRYGKFAPVQTPAAPAQLEGPRLRIVA